LFWDIPAAGIAPFQLAGFALLWQAMKNMRLQGIHVSDIVEQHCPQ
jgi:hypothetical protein